MMDQSGVARVSMCAAVVFLTVTLCAQNEQPASAAAQAPAVAPQQPAVNFAPLVRVINVQGFCEVNNPDKGKFDPAQNNKAYPLGTVVRTGPGSSAIIVFSDQETVQLSEKTELSFAAAEKVGNGRFVRFVSGKIKTNLRDNLPEGSFGVETPNVSCKNVAGRGDFSLTVDANVQTFQAATITGSMIVEGPQYRIPALRAANTVNIQTALDRSLCRLTSVSGDFTIVLENGTDAPVNYAMSPKAVVKIWHENAPVGGRPIISTLVVSPTGMARHRFAYAEGRPNLTTGELIDTQAAEEKEKEAALPVLLTKEAATGKEKAPVEKKPEATSASK